MIWPPICARVGWDDRPYRLVLEPSDEHSVSAIGFEVADDRDLHAIVGDAGIGEHHRDDGLCRRSGPSAGEWLRVAHGPNGAPIELFYGPILSHELLSTPLVSGFVTGEMGLGHVVIKVPDLDESIAFYRDRLDFHLRNTWYFGGMSMAFLECNPRHHSLAFGCELPSPRLLMHFMVEMATIDDVGRAQDRCVDNGVPVVIGLGRHTNDHMISFYCQTPDGFMVEAGWGGLQIDDPSTHSARESCRVTRPTIGSGGATSVNYHLPTRQRPRP